MQSWRQSSQNLGLALAAEAELELRRRRTENSVVVDATLEDLFSSTAYAGLDASPAQRLICRAADGLPLGDVGEADPELVKKLFGTYEVPPHRPRVVEIVAGVRSGKSFLSATAALRCGFRADFSRMPAHEIARAGIVANTVANAESTFEKLCGLVETSPGLRACRMGTPANGTLRMRRPDGRIFEIVAVAATRGGANLRSRWLVAAILDELALFGTETSGASVSAEEVFHAGRTRLLPGGQVWLISSPFGPTGLLYDTWKTHYKHPGKTLVAWAPTEIMNPTIDREDIAEIRRTNPDIAAREYDAQWLDATSSFFDTASVERAQRATPLVRLGTGNVAAAMDAGTRGNAWTLCTAWVDGDKTIVGGAHEWKGSKTAPLSPEATFRDIAEILLPQGCTSIGCDGWSFDANKDIAIRHGLSLVQVPSADTVAAYGRAKTLFDTDTIELPPVVQLRDDLRGVIRRATSGGVRIDLAKTSDGRHCDFAPSMVNAAARASRGGALPSYGDDEDQDLGKRRY